MELQQVISFISQADDLALDEIANALTARYKAVLPGYEMAFISLPLNDPARREALGNLIKWVMEK